MRRLSLLPCALLLAFGASAPNLIAAKPAHAVVYGCNHAGDLFNTVYEDDWRYTRAGQWIWVPEGHYAWIGTDLKAYRYSSSSDGNCYRAYYVSTWTEDQSISVVFRPQLRAWTCGNYSGAWDAGEWWQWNKRVFTTGTWGAYPNLNLPVQMWDGGWETLSFGNYYHDTSLCGPQADNVNSYGRAGPPNDWAWYLQSVTGGSWYVHLDGFV